MKRALLSVAAGAVPIALLVLVLSNYPPELDDVTSIELGLCTGLGAFWGLTAGVMRRSLLRAIVGLNVGALCGYFFHVAALTRVNVSNFGVILSLMVAGAVLGAALNFQRDSMPHALTGMLVGALAFLYMGCSAWLVAQTRNDGVAGWIIMCVVPFGGGIWIFNGLLSAFAPAARIEQSASGATLSDHDHTRGRDSAVTSSGSDAAGSSDTGDANAG